MVGLQRFLSSLSTLYLLAHLEWKSNKEIVQNYLNGSLLSNPKVWLTGDELQGEQWPLTWWNDVRLLRDTVCSLGPGLPGRKLLVVLNGVWNSPDASVARQDHSCHLLFCPRPRTLPPSELTLCCWIPPGTTSPSAILYYLTSTPSSTVLTAGGTRWPGPFCMSKFT